MLQGVGARVQGVEGRVRGVDPGVEGRAQGVGEQVQSAGGEAGGRGAPILRRKDVARALGLANAVRRGSMEVKVQLIGVRECTQIMVGGGPVPGEVRGPGVIDSSIIFVLHLILGITNAF